MATHILINPDVATDTTQDKAFLDVAGEPRSADVTFNIFPAAGPPQTITIPMSSKNIAISPDLFSKSGRKTALIVAVTTDPTSPSVAVLRQVIGRSKEAITIPSSNRMLGTAFNLPLADLSGGGDLYIGNPNGADANAVINYGSSTSPSAGQVRVPALGVVKFKLTQAETNVVVTVTNEVPVIVQAALCTRLLVVFPIGPAV